MDKAIFCVILKPHVKSMVYFQVFISEPVGMLFMGVAVGIIIGAILSNAGLLVEGANYTSMIFFFGGLGLVIYYIFDRKNA